MRYFIVNEFFGLRVYDSFEKKERYYTHKDAVKIKKEIEDNYIEINKPVSNNRISAPIKISMNITKDCNLRCKQCFSNSGEILAEELSTKDIYKLFDSMQDNGTFFIAIGGGEPLIRKDLLDILEYGKHKQLAISIVSNGLLLTEKLIKELNEKDIDTFWVSIDGLEKNHEFCRGKGTYNKAIASIKLLKKYFNSKIAIRISLSKGNIHEWKPLLDLAEQLKVDIIRFTPLLSFGRAKNENLMISQDEYISFLNEIENVKSSITVIHPNITNSSKFWANTTNFGCHCGKEAIWIDEVGNYSPCIFLGEDYNVGNIKYEDYMDLWVKSQNISVCDGNDICKTCNNYNRCRGGCRARVLDVCNNLDDVDPLCPLKRNLIKAVRSSK